MTLKDLKSYTTWLAGWLVLGILFSAVAAPLFLPTDDTDTGRFNRSGLGLHVDAGTGCEYLSAPRGGLVPRMDGSTQRGCRR